MAGAQLIGVAFVVVAVLAIGILPAIVLCRLYPAGEEER